MMEDTPIEDYLEFQCPYCGEPNGLAFDPTAGDAQELVQDCEVCCRPIHLHLKFNLSEDEDGTFELDVRTDKD